jgi:hypothetical protein
MPILKPVNGACQRKTLHWNKLPKRFVVLQNLLVLDGKLQYPALAPHTPSGVET